ncbi:MAG: prepilin-type N-terminal cleavage/methylation domain-containing protein [Methylacidiphilales bacterium]|nr:prepilin-type N-terminal cleavage/methylation domain-containing protein [Candidatus Methylacidiphilales bacterium]MDW8350029.1 prepilin-type N-terminal cleavage/methylation domain-containing protein [Verrucomicrobiae bacterium]
MAVECSNLGERRAFTLLEVMLAVSVLALLVGMLWTVVKSSIESAHYIQQVQTEQQQFVALNAFLENLFRRLPAEAQITSRLKDQGSKGLSLLYITNAPGAIYLLNQGANIDTLVLGAREQIGGYVQFSLFSSASAVDTSDENEPPLDLIKDLADIQWRYFDVRSQQWMTDWLDTSTKPGLIELTLKPAGKNEASYTFTYWIPPLVKPSTYDPRANPDQPPGAPPGGASSSPSNFMPQPNTPGSTMPLQPIPYGPRPLPGTPPPKP